jgi:hypothetical protein
MNTSREVYREESGWPVWIYLILAVSLVGSLAAVLGDRGWSGISDPDLLFAAGVMALLYVLIWLFLMGLTVVLRTDVLEVGLGRGWPIRTRIPLDQIVGMESVTYSPLGDFGGWGVRGTRERRAWTARGNRALKLTLSDGREVFVGSEHPERLEERIRGLGRAGTRRS